MACADPSLVVLTTAVEAERAGCLVGFHAQSSITPEHYCVWLSKANHTYRLGLPAAPFVVHFLPPPDRPVQKPLGPLPGDDPARSAGIESKRTRTASPCWQ